MITKVLGTVDLLVAVFFIINLLDTGGWFPNKIVLIAGIYLLVKGALFLAFLDFASIFDVICSIIILTSLYMAIPVLFSILAVFFLVQKAFFSIIAN